MRLLDLLRTMDIFEHLSSEALERIARLLRERRLPEGELLFTQGDSGDAMFIVTGGKIRLFTLDPTGNEKVLTYFTDGQFFGEMSLLTGAPRSASAAADSESRVLVLNKGDFDQLLAEQPQIMREMLKVVSQRTVQTNQQLLSDDNTSAAAAGTGKIYVVFSPRGGSGKSTIAVNLSLALLRSMPERVALMDLDLTFGHAALLLNVGSETSLSQVPPESLAQFDRQTLGRYLVAHPSGLQVLVGGTRPEEGETVTGDHVRSALSVMKRQFMAVVVDCGVSFNDPTLAALELADKVLLVATPELNTLRDVRECQRIFGEVIHLDKAKVTYVLNHYQPFKVLTREQFESALEQTVGVEVPHGGDALVRAALKGEPALVSAPSSPFVKAVEKLAFDLTPEELRQQAKGKGPRVPVASAAAAATATNGASHKSKGLLSLFRR